MSSTPVPYSSVQQLLTVGAGGLFHMSHYTTACKICIFLKFCFLNASTIKNAKSVIHQVRWWRGSQNPNQYLYQVRLVHIPEVSWKENRRHPVLAHESTAVRAPWSCAIPYWNLPSNKALFQAAILHGAPKHTFFWCRTLMQEHWPFQKSVSFGFCDLLHITWLLQEHCWEGMHPSFGTQHIEAYAICLFSLARPTLSVSL